MLTLRIDDRLIHTQLVAGWIQALALNRVIVANDAAAGDPPQRLAMEMALPPGVACCVCPVDEVADALREKSRQIIIVASLACASRVIARLPTLNEINLANAMPRCREDRRRFAASVWLSEEEEALLRDLQRQGIRIVHHPAPPADNQNQRSNNGNSQHSGR